MTGHVHLHARYGREGDTRCLTVCGRPCDSVPVAYRDLNPERVTCPDCKDPANLRNDKPWR